MGPAPMAQSPGRGLRGRQPLSALISLLGALLPGGRDTPEVSGGARSVAVLWGYHLGSGPSGRGSPPGGLSHRDSAKWRLGPDPQRL